MEIKTHQNGKINKTNSRKGYPSSSVVKNPPAMQETEEIPGSRRSPGREWLPTPVFLPRESHRQKSLASYSPWGHKESDMTERLITFMFYWNLQFYNKQRFSSSIWSNCTSNFLTWWTAQISYRYVAESKAILFCQRLCEWIDFF